MDAIGVAARRAARSLAMVDGERRDRALRSAAASVHEHCCDILEANAIDISDATDRGLNPSMRDRLMLDADRVESMATGLEAIAELPDPLGRILAEWQRPNGLQIQRVTVPIGVIGIIYESRPNVTADAAGLCIKSGNAVILRGGSESFHSNHAIHACVKTGLEAAAIDTDAVQIVPTTDRAAVGYLM